MRQLIFVTVILISVQMLHANVIPSEENKSHDNGDCGCGNPEIKEKKIEEKKEDLIFKLNACTEELKCCQDDKNTLQVQVDKWKRIADEEKTKNIKLTESNNNLKNDLTRTQDQLKAQIATNCELEKAITHYKIEIDQNIVLLGKCEIEKLNSLSMCNKKNSDLEKAKLKLETENNLLKEKYECDLKECEERANKLQKSIDKLKIELLSEHERLTICEDKFNCLENSYSEIKDKYEVAKAEIELLTRRVKHLEDIIKQDEKFDTEAANTIITLKMKIDEHIRNSETDNVLIQELKSRIVCLENDFSEQVKQFQKTTSGLEAKSIKLEKEWQAMLEKERSATREELCTNDKLRGEKKKLIDELNETKKALADCLNAKNECNKKIGDLTIIIKSLECERDQLKEDLLACQRRYTELVKELTLCQDKYKQCTAERKRCQEDLDTAECKIKELIIEITKLEKAKKQCEVDLASLECETKQILTKIGNNSDALSILLINAINLNKSTKDDSSNYIKQHKLECKEEPHCACQDGPK